MVRVLLSWDSFILSMSFRPWPLKNQWMETSVLFVERVRTTESLFPVTVVLLAWRVGWASSSVGKHRR